MNPTDRKIIHIFKSFIERVFVPQLPKMEFTCLQEWNKFSSMISTEMPNLNEIQLYVDTLPTINAKHSFERIETKSPVFSKIRRDSTSEHNNGGASFNPSRTFGGERARMMFPLKDFDDGAVERNSYHTKDSLKDKEEISPGITTQMVLPTI